MSKVAASPTGAGMPVASRADVHSGRAIRQAQRRNAQARQSRPVAGLAQRLRIASAVNQGELLLQGHLLEERGNVRSRGLTGCVRRQDEKRQGCAP